MDWGHIFHNISYIYPPIKENTPADKVQTLFLIFSYFVVLCETVFKHFICVWVMIGMRKLESGHIII